MEKKKLSLEPGRHYKGTFWLNEYGEIQVRPEQKGSKPMNMKTVLEITQAMKNIFPNDVALGDFALFGYGVEGNDF